MSGYFVDSSVADFWGLAVPQLKDFIHFFKFTGKTCREAWFDRNGKKLNKTLWRGKTAESIENECIKESPCLVWLAWHLRKYKLVLKPLQMTVLRVTLQVLSFSTGSNILVSSKQIYSLDYLGNNDWMNAFPRVVRGVGVLQLNESMTMNANRLSPALEQRLGLHATEPLRMYKLKQKHLHFVFHAG